MMKIGQIGTQRVIEITTNIGMMITVLSGGNLVFDIITLQVPSNTVVGLCIAGFCIAASSQLFIKNS